MCCSLQCDFGINWVCDISDRADFNFIALGSRQKASIYLCMQLRAFIYLCMQLRVSMLERSC